jgi:hypothetical protein
MKKKKRHRKKEWKNTHRYRKEKWEKANSIVVIVVIVTRRCHFWCVSRYTYSYYERRCVYIRNSHLVKPSYKYTWRNRYYFNGLSMIFTVKSNVCSSLFLSLITLVFSYSFFSTMYLTFFLLLEIGLLAQSPALLAAVVRSMHAFALFLGIQRHAAVVMTTTTILLRINI